LACRSTVFAASPVSCAISRAVLPASDVDCGQVEGSLNEVDASRTDGCGTSHWRTTEIFCLHVARYVRTKKDKAFTVFVPFPIRSARARMAKENRAIAKRLARIVARTVVRLTPPRHFLSYF
jgi:hypothetical protein